MGKFGRNLGAKSAFFVPKYGGKSRAIHRETVFRPPPRVLKEQEDDEPERLPAEPERELLGNAWNGLGGFVRVLPSLFLRMEISAFLRRFPRRGRGISLHAALRFHHDRCFAFAKASF